MIRRATPDAAPAIATLYHDTVKKINSRDYAATQINAEVQNRFAERFRLNHVPSWNK